MPEMSAAVALEAHLELAVLDFGNILDQVQVFRVNDLEADLSLLIDLARFGIAEVVIEIIGGAVGIGLEIVFPEEKAGRIESQLQTVAVIEQLSEIVAAFDHRAEDIGSQFESRNFEVEPAAFF